MISTGISTTKKRLARWKDSNKSKKFKTIEPIYIKVERNLLSVQLSDVEISDESLKHLLNKDSNKSNTLHVLRMFLSTKAGKTRDGDAYTLSKLNAFFLGGVGLTDGSDCPIRWEV